MSKMCEITGKRAQVGHKVSHSNRKMLRRFNPSLFVRKFYVPEEKKWITLKVSSAGLRTINKKGIFESLKAARAKGFTDK